MGAHAWVGNLQRLEEECRSHIPVELGQVSAKSIMKRVCQTHQWCCMAWQKCLPHEYWRGAKSAAKHVDAVDYLMTNEEMKPGVLVAALMAHV